MRRPTGWPVPYDRRSLLAIGALLAAVLLPPVVVYEPAWELAAETLAAGHHRLVILDEITYPMSWGWISTEDVVESIRARPQQVSVIATGRQAPRALLDVADNVTEMVKVRHAFDSGVRAIKGIDY